MFVNVPLGYVTIRDDGGRDVYELFTDAETHTARVLVNRTIHLRQQWAWFATQARPIEETPDASSK